jgi:Tol biopolymer transport system component
LSRDGKRVAWSARQPGGTYELRVADLVLAPVPHLERMRSYRPGGAAYYETGAFTTDGRGLTYTSDQDTHSFWHSQIYVLDLATGAGKRLTRGDDYNEHPVVVAAPSGDWIVYMSTRGVQRRPGHLLLGTDWYAMRLDGTGTKRLTTMNLSEPNNPEDTGAMQVAGRVSPGPAPDVLFGDVQDNLVKQTGSTKRIRLVCK